MNKYLDLNGLSYFWNKIKSYAVKRISSTDNAVVRFDGTDGNVQNSGITIDDNNVITTPGDIILKNSSNGAATPKIEFRRGSNTDTYNDWHINTNSSGNLIVGLKASSSAAVAKATLTSSGITFANSLEASSIKKTGGTSSQFLKADGSVDSTSYIQTVKVNNTPLTPDSNKAVNIDLTSYLQSQSVEVVTIQGSIDDYISEEGLPSGTYNTLIGYLSQGKFAILKFDNASEQSVQYLIPTYIDFSAEIDFIGDAGKMYILDNSDYLDNYNNLQRTSEKVTSISASSTNQQYPSAKLLYDQLQLKANLASPTFTGGITVSNGDVSVNNGDLSVNGDIALSGNVELNNAILYENGNISTFGSFIKSGGTSSQFLKADGSVDSSNYAGSQSAGGPANKTVSIPFGQVDSTSTATAFTATVDGITELRDGVCVWLRNGVINSESGYTININNLGAKPVYASYSGGRSGTGFAQNTTYLFIYNSTRVTDGCWDADFGYYEDDTDYRAYQIRTNSQSLPASAIIRSRRLLFTSADGSKYVPANTTSSTTTTYPKTPTTTKINPFGAILYYNSTSNTSSGATPSSTILYQQINIQLGYSFNWSTGQGDSLTLTDNAPVYLKCIPQADGSAKIATNADIPIVQSLPTTDDGKIYIFLGNATSATAVELMLNHPVYYYKNGAIRLWTGPV